jgi:deoxyhypusine synthase
MVFSEATLAMPLVVGYAYHKAGWRGRKGKKWSTLLETAAVA